ncbi:Fe-S cluster assembly protein SufD [Corynebacterium sp. zg254]|uniref:Fe-S cluster assembly protein SufD n=1 Tax=Corynebacterium zhongnanshanii TaxID=2768834 RepID=A0ABQ6VGN4_9CORY|nr:MULTISPECIES: Fe-S cluster assembly protein SufD [Corynebacterium]KAB3523483.1 Fe-S cluster assembly protein SufD [Corynebacterium zhongnanshanii]MCR5913372.1 Fe-S cluster assembly protein SufD [Corynebacterium sp. zg254]
MSTPLNETEATITPVAAGTDHQTKGDRFTSFSSADFDIPKGRDEDWRFTPLRKLRGLHDGSASQGKRASVSVTGVTDDVSVEELDMSDAKLGRAGAPVDRAAAQAWENTPKADYVRVASNAVLSEPVVVTIEGPGEDTVSYGSLVIEVEAHAEAVVFVHYTGSGAHSDNLEFVIGDGAQLTTVVLEDWAPDAVHLSNSHLQVGRDATVRHYYAAFGGQVVRSVPHVRYTGPGGDAEMLGLYFADSGQYFEQRLLVDHSIKNCRSNVLYKGALQSTGEDDKSEARTAWIGDVLIRPEATGTDTYEKNNNLLLSPGARADAVPNLEIQTGEIVGAGHAATVGRFDDEHMFYLQSRGISAAEAKMLIVRGFFTDVIKRIPIESIREDLEQKVERELASTVL